MQKVNRKETAVRHKHENSNFIQPSYTRTLRLPHSHKSKNLHLNRIKCTLYNTFILFSHIHKYIHTALAQMQDRTLKN